MIYNLPSGYKDEAVFTIIKETSKIACLDISHWRDYLFRRDEIIQKFIDNDEVATMEAYNTFHKLVRTWFGYSDSDYKASRPDSFILFESLSNIEGIINAWFYYRRKQGYEPDPMKDFDEEKH